MRRCFAQRTDCPQRYAGLFAPDPAGHFGLGFDWRFGLGFWLGFWLGVLAEILIEVLAGVFLGLGLVVAVGCFWPGYYVESAKR